MCRIVCEKRENIEKRIKMTEKEQTKMGDRESIKIVTFSGKKADWAVWEEKMLARAQRRGYKDVILGRGIPVPKTGEEGLNDIQVLIRDLNVEAYTDLILAMDGDTEAGRVAFSCVKGSKSKDYEDGHAATAFASLKKKYQPCSSLIDEY